MQISKVPRVRHITRWYSPATGSQNFHYQTECLGGVGKAPYDVRILPPFRERGMGKLSEHRVWEVIGWVHMPGSFSLYEKTS